MYERDPPPPHPPLFFVSVVCARVYSIVNHPRSDGGLTGSDTDSRGEFGSDPNEYFGGFAGFDKEAARDALEGTN